MTSKLRPSIVSEAGTDTPYSFRICTNSSTSTPMSISAIGMDSYLCRKMPMRSVSACWSGARSYWPSASSVCVRAGTSWS